MNNLHHRVANKGVLGLVSSGEEDDGAGEVGATARVTNRIVGEGQRAPSRISFRNVFWERVRFLFEVGCS